MYPASTASRAAQMDPTLMGRRIDTDMVRSRYSEVFTLSPLGSAEIEKRDKSLLVGTFQACLSIISALLIARYCNANFERFEKWLGAGDRLPKLTGWPRFSRTGWADLWIPAAKRTPALRRQICCRVGSASPVCVMHWPNGRFNLSGSGFQLLRSGPRRRSAEKPDRSVFPSLI